MTTATLTAEQGQAYTLAHLVFEGSIKAGLIQGSPGTGKTYVVSEVLNEIKQKQPYRLKSIAVATPTHKAKRVVQGYLEANGFEVDCYTLHSILGLGAGVDEDSGKQKFDAQSNDKRPIEKYDVIWIDECSMIDSSLFSALLGSPVRLLFTGDKRQLLPVGENSFPVFDYFTGRKDRVELTEPQRYSGAIKELVYACIPCIDNKKLFDPSSYLLDESCHLVRDWFSHWAASSEPDKVVLTFTNRDVDKLNQRCREHIYGPNPDNFYPEEEVITYSVVNDLAGQPFVSNGSICHIDFIEEDLMAQGSEVFITQLVKFKEYYHKCRIIHPSHEKKWKDYLTQLSKDCKNGKRRWRDFYWVQGLIAQFKATHALTIHKSQGSGWNDVYFIDCFKYLGDVELQPRLHYVGASRAKKNLLYANKV